MKQRSFPGGIHPLRKQHHGKPLCCHKAIETLDAPAVVEIPLAQHIGAPCAPTVQKGDQVKVGTKIGEPRGFIGAPVFSSVSGTVKELFARTVAGGNFVQCVRIENDGLDTWEELSPASMDALDGPQIIERVKNAGIVGMGGAGFPTHVKLSPPKGKTIDSVILNAAECEPYLTCDHRLLLEQPEKVVKGLLLVCKAVGGAKGFIGVETNKPDAIEALQKEIQGTGLTIVPLKPKYPQGSEKHLIYAVTGRQVPSGGLPADVGCIVCNVGSAVAICEAVLEGKPLVQRVVCVTGPGIREPKNLFCRIGTPVQTLIDACGGLNDGTVKVLSGGPMMGQALYDLTVPVVKNMSGITALPDQHIPQPSACIHCGRCAEGCPMHLMPMLLSMYSESNDFESAEKAHVLDCVECGSCSYVCPAARPILAGIRVAKQSILAERRRRG